MTYLAFALPVTLALMMGSAALFMHFAGLSLTTKLHGQSLELQFGFLFALILPIPFGFWLGGWIWSRIAKTFLGISRLDMETLLLDRRLRIGFLDRANRAAIERLYRSDEHG